MPLLSLRKTLTTYKPINGAIRSILGTKNPSAANRLLSRRQTYKLPSFPSLQHAEFVVHRLLPCRRLRAAHGLAVIVWIRFNSRRSEKGVFNELSVRESVISGVGRLDLSKENFRIEGEGSRGSRGFTGGFSGFTRRFSALRLSLLSRFLRLLSLPPFACWLGNMSALGDCAARRNGR